MRIWKLGVPLAAVLALALTPATVLGQNVYGTITGTVTDASGAVISDAAVSLTNLDNGEKHSIQTNASGNYTFVNLLPGRYKIEGEKAGFKKFVREPIDVEIEAGLRVDIALPIGAQSETVEVTSETPLLQPETNSLGQVVEGRTVTELPLNGRNPLAMVAMVPGIVPQGQPSAGNSSGGNPVGANPFAMGDFQVGGGQAGQSQILIDGVPTNGAYLNVVTVIPTQDAISEFKVQTNNLGPEYGRFAGGVINLSTKSGTNGLHGSLYEFLRNKVLNANDFFANQAGIARPPFTQNQFGGNAGGRIIRDKLFFFGSYEGFRQRKGSIFTSWVPDAAERTGDFSGVGTTGTSQPFTIYDPTKSGTAFGNPACQAPNPICRTPFAGNVIPADRIDPTAQVLLSYMPLPNQTGNPNGNFVESYSTGGDVDQYNGRVDFNLSARQRIFGRYTHSHILSLPDSPFNDICTDRCTENTTAQQVSLSDTIAISPKTVLDLHLGYTRYIYLRTPLSEGIDMSKFGANWAALAPQMTYTHIPQVCISETPGDDRWGGGWCAQGTGSGIGAWDDTLSFTPMLSKIMGKHNFKFGGEFRMLRNDYYQSNDPAGLLFFDAGMTAANPQSGIGTSGGTSPQGGNGFASFLLGYGSTTNDGSVTEPARTADEVKYGAIYVGDTFQATRKLTLNLGARFDLQGDWTERFNRIVAVNPTETSPLLALDPGLASAFPNLKGRFDLVDSGPHPSRSAFPSWKNISPRLGVSYQLDRNTVIRSGYGMFFLPVDIRWNDAPHNLFINSFVTPFLTTLPDGVTPRATLSNPFPDGITPPFGRNQGLIDIQGNGNEAPAGNTPPPYVQQWNLDIQRQFPGNTLVDIAYAGSKGTHLPMHDQTLDQLPDQYLPQNSPNPAQQITTLTTVVNNPFAGNCPPPAVCTGPLQSGGMGTNATVKQGQLLLPFPQFDGFTVSEPDNRDSIYHSMQLKVEKRFSAGAQVLASYTVSKLIDDTNSEINWLEAAAPSWNDFDVYNRRSFRSLDGFDVPQRLVLGSVLDLPFGRGKKFANNVNGIGNKVIGGWGVDTIITFQRGFPIIIGGCPGPLSSLGIPGVGCSRPTKTGPSSLTSGPLETRLTHWFNTSVFTNGTPGVYNYGNDPRAEPNIRDDGSRNFDFAIFKNTKFGTDDRYGLEFRTEFFNGFNHPQFSPPNTSCCTGANFGQVTSQYNLPRLIQFGLRTTF